MTDPAVTLTHAPLAALAARVKVDEKAVRKAVRNGRLERSLVYVNGRPMIADLALAEQEWRDNADVSKHRGKSPQTIAEERRRLIQAQRRKVNLEIRQRRGELVPRQAVEMRFSTRVVTARTKLLGIPSRAKQRLPHLTVADLEVLDVLIREALDELADDAGAR